MRTEAPAAAAEILLLSDQDAEVTLIKGAAGNGHFHIVEVCPAVLAFLRRQDLYRDCPRPDLILLDLNLSNSEHCDTLKEIKEDPEFRRIPVVVMAADDSSTSILDAYDLHANAYIVKPKRADQFVRVVTATLSFWLNLARLPKD